MKIAYTTCPSGERNPARPNGHIKTSRLLTTLPIKIRILCSTFFVWSYRMLGYDGEVTHSGTTYTYRLLRFI